MDEYNDSLSKYRLELVEKVIEVLTAFSPDHRELTLAELTARTQQSESSVYRIVANLTRLGFLARDAQTRKFSIGIRAYSVGSLALRSMNTVVRPRMEELCERYSLTVNLSVRDQLEVLIVDVVEKYSVVPDRIVGGHARAAPLHRVREVPPGLWSRSCPGGTARSHGTAATLLREDVYDTRRVVQGARADSAHRGGARSRRVSGARSVYCGSDFRKC